MDMAGAAGAGAAAAIAQATKASGVIVQLEPEEFQRVLYRADHPLVVVSSGGVFRESFKYLMSHRGLAFYTRSDTRLHLPGGAEVVEAKSIWVP
jgi:hypothetical protein